MNTLKKCLNNKSLCNMVLIVAGLIYTTLYIFLSDLYLIAVIAIYDIYSVYNIKNKNYTRNIIIALCNIILFIIISNNTTNNISYTIVFILLACIINLDLGKNNRFILAGYIVTGLLVYNIIGNYFYFENRNYAIEAFKNSEDLYNKECKFKPDFEFNLNRLEEDSNWKLKMAIDNENIYKANLYNIISAIKEDKQYMLDINGTEQTDWDKINYLEGLAIEFLNNLGNKENTIDEIYNTKYVNECINRYKKEVG